MRDQQTDRQTDTHTYTTLQQYAASMQITQCCP